MRKQAEYISLLTVIFLASASATLRLHGIDCPSLYSDISEVSARVELPMFGNPDWTPHIGKKVTVVFGPKDEITQTVLGPEHLSSETRRAAENLLNNSRIGWPIRFMAVEVGSWMLVTDQGTYHSTIFTSKERDSLYYVRDGKKPFEEVKNRISQNEVLKELALFHTHIGRGEPLNRHDIAAIEREARKAFAEYPLLEAVTLYAVPLKNGGELYFRHRILRPSSSE